MRAQLLAPTSDDQVIGGMQTAAGWRDYDYVLVHSRLTASRCLSFRGWQTDPKLRQDVVGGHGRGQGARRSGANAGHGVSATGRARRHTANGV